jgi:hypothetical protein
VIVYLIHATAKGVSMDTHCERVLQQIAFGYVLTPSGGMRKMYNHEMISLAREACDQLGIAYSGGACTQPFETRRGVAEVDLPRRTGKCTGPELTNASGRSRV